MKNISKTLVILALSATFATVQTSADSLDSKQKVQQITCKTEQECDKLSLSIQVQIDELKTKGIVNLTNDEFEKYANLNKQLLATQDSIIEIKKAKTKEAREKTKEAREKNKKLRAKIEEQNKKLETLYGEIQEKFKSIENSLPH